jgi:type III pantothenate kinase
MLLAVDVGNITVTLGVYDGETLRGEWSVATDRRKTADEYGLLFSQLLEHAGIARSAVMAVAISSSVPPLVPTLEETCRRYFGHPPFVVGPGVKTGMVIRYDNPREVTADRIVIAVAAFEKYGGPVIVVDFSTATIFDVISQTGEYLGGVIAPGVQISAEALFQQAAKLPRIELVRPAAVLGRNTVHSMQSGIIFGFAGQVEEIVARLVAELGQETVVVATGDLAGLMAGEVKSIRHVEPYLSLEGLRIIYERNQPRQGV